MFAGHFGGSVRYHNSNGYEKIEIETKVVSVIYEFKNGVTLSVDYLELTIIWNTPFYASF